ncbi:MAG: TolC family protein [Terracidiphilus sp.]|jgi:outer membrane protein TolC
MKSALVKPPDRRCDAPAIGGGVLGNSAASCFRAVRPMKRRRIARLLILASIAVSPIAAAGQETLSLDMASVANLAKTRSWAAKQAHEDAAAANANAKAVESLRWGRISSENQYLRFNDPIVISSPVPSYLAAILGIKSLNTTVAEQDNLHVSLQAGIPLFTGGKITHAIRAAHAGSDAAAQSANDTDDDVVLNAENAYLSTLLAQQVVSLHEMALRSYQGHLEHAQSAFKQGTAARYDVIRAEAAVAEQEKRLTEAKNQLALAQAALRTSLALDDSAAVRIDGQLFEVEDAVNPDQAIAASVRSSPILKALNAKIAAERNSVRMEQGDYLPQITAIASKELVTNKLAQTDPTWVVGAHASWELFDGGERRAKVSVARAQLAGAEDEYRHAEEQIRLAVRSACLDLESQRSELVSGRKAAELAAESLRLATKRFEVGTGTSLEVLDANVALTASQIEIQHALYGIDLAYLRIHRYQGDIAEVAARIQK